MKNFRVKIDGKDVAKVMGSSKWHAMDKYYYSNGLTIKRSRMSAKEIKTK